jgi:transcriptional regulator with XRE-family HTH domain
MTLMKQSEFAELCGVSRAAVTNWRNGAELVMQGALVDVEATHAKMLRHRKGGSPLTGVRVNGVLLGAVDPADMAAPPEAAPAKALEDLIRPGESVEQAALRLSAQGSGEMRFDEARRLKEYWLMRLNELELEQKSGVLVDLELASSILFETARAARDAWLNWPAKVGPLVASQLGVEAADKVTAVLAEHVHNQISQLGEPEANFTNC